ncbi:histidine kinase [Natrinema saccharevitans]|uniref:Histidine kinase n=1 Tax=Natrinema saccharevitans TaxID=301967 RepID=A0A1S8AX19_9EURY|nr:DICT sensory domain-containing protein [Natrinema saccharevitans]OLZ41089.1 histidine kinase [Natrinema saccharevitans]
MRSLRDAFEAVDRRHKTLEIHSDDESVVTALRRGFETRTVDVTRRPLGLLDGAGFVIVRDADGAFRGALGLEGFEAILSPTAHPPWELVDAEPDPAHLFDFLENTLFASATRGQLLATSREIEERAWRAGAGRLYAGFQRPAALRTQAAVYERFGACKSIDVTAFLAGEWSTPLEGVSVVTGTGGELGAFWFVVFDGGEDGRHCGALIAEERDPDEYAGFWTFEPSIVRELSDYLETIDDA